MCKCVVCTYITSTQHTIRTIQSTTVHANSASFETIFFYQPKKKRTKKIALEPLIELGATNDKFNIYKLNTIVTEIAACLGIV